MLIATELNCPMDGMQQQQVTIWIVVTFVMLQHSLNLPADALRL
jgi:hypothetical protein